MAIAVHEIHPVDEILCLTESLQITAAQIAEVLGIKYNSVETYRIVNNKYCMRQHLCENGLTSMSFAVVDNRNDVEKFFLEGKENSIIVKPVDGIGSKSIIRITSLDDVKQLSDQFDCKMIAETYLPGREFSVEAVSFRGKNRVLCITQKFKDESNFVEKGHLVPANISSDEFLRIAEYVENVLTSIGVYTGVTHTEVMLNADRVEVVETHIRIGGDFIPEIIEKASGFNLFELQAKLTLNDENECEKIFEIQPLSLSNKKCFSMVGFKFIDKSGVIKEIKNIPSKKNNKDIVLVKVDSVGDCVKRTCDSFTRGMMIIIEGNTAETCIDKCRHYMENTEYIIEES